MKIEPIYFNGFINFLHTPESDEERDAVIAMAIQSETAEKMSEIYEEIIKTCEERKCENGNI